MRLSDNGGRDKHGMLYAWERNASGVRVGKPMGVSYNNGPEGNRMGACSLGLIWLRTGTSVRLL